MSLVRTFLATFASKGVGFLATLLGGIAVSRTLGPGGKGEVDVTVMLAALLVMISFPSLEEPQLRHLGERRTPPRVLLSNALLAALVFGLGVLGIFEFCARHFPEWFSGRDPRTGLVQATDLGLLRTLVAMAPFAIGHRMVAGWLQGLGDMRAFNRAFVVQNLVLLAGICLLVLGLGGGARGAVHAHALSQISGFAVALWAALRRPEARGGPRWPAPLPLLRLVGDGLRLHGGVIAAFVILESDKLVLFKARGFEAVGLYAVAVALTGYLRRLVLQPVKDVVGSRLPELMRDPEQLAPWIARATRSTLPLILVPGLGLMLGGWLAIAALYGWRFLPAYGPLLVLVPGSVCWSLAVVMGYWFIGSGRFVQLTAVGILVAAANLGLNLLLVPRYGMLAAAATSTACYALHLSVFTLWVSKKTGLPPSALLLPTRADLGLISEVGGKIPILGKRLRRWLPARAPRADAPPREGGD